MKRLKLLSMLTAVLVGFAVRTYAQVVLPEVTITAVKYKYLNAVDYKDAPEPVKVLQQQAATYNVKLSQYYNDDYDYYYISFYIPNGRILAAYDKDGKLLRTAEKYKNIQLPKAVTAAIGTRFPNWSISKDVYLVSFYDARGTSSKRYNLLLENGDKRMKVNINDKGEFL